MDNSGEATEKKPVVIMVIAGVRPTPPVQSAAESGCTMMSWMRRRLSIFDRR